MKYRKVQQPGDLTCAVALDVGGTNIRGGVCSFPSGRILIKDRIPTLADRSGAKVLSDALAFAQDLVGKARESGLRFLGIGLSVGELVDLEGNVTSGSRIQWEGLPVKNQFSALAPTIVDADVRAGARGEALFGVGQRFRIFAYVTVGTGMSHSLVIDGEPFAGARGNALILSSSPLTTICTECGAILNPILDEIASGPALVARYNASGPASEVARAEQIFEAVDEGDTLAWHVLSTAGEALGTSVGFLVNVMDPEAVVVGGGLGLAGGAYWDSFVSSTRAHIWSDTNRAIPILPAALGVEAGLIGAAASVWQWWGEP
jgi:glucokinase